MQVNNIGHACVTLPAAPCAQEGACREPRQPQGHRQGRRSGLLEGSLPPQTAQQDAALTALSAQQAAGSTAGLVAMCCASRLTR